MSRWQDNFANHAFQAPWKEVKTLIDTLAPSPSATEPNIKELARLKKVIKYIDELLISADVELIPLSVWNSFSSETTNALNQIKNFDSNDNYAHLTSANANIDNLLAYISPHVRSGKRAAQAAGQAFKAYSNTVHKYIGSLKADTETAVTEINAYNAVAKSSSTEIQTVKDNISELEKKLLIGDEDDESLKAKMLALESEANEWHTKIDEFHQKLTAGSEEESSIILQIEEAKTKSIENTTKIEEALVASNDTIKTLTAFHTKIFGKTNEDGIVTSGLKQELKARNDHLDAFKLKQEKEYATLNTEIESLLPGATTAGLATAYRELKESFDTPIENATRLFYAALSGLLLVGLVLIVDKIGWFFVDFKEIDEPIKLLNNILYKLPITVPLVWLAIFTSRRRSESRRLQQEYAHKEALAKSYQSFKKQIEDLGDNGDEALLKQLLDAAIKTVSFNASTTLDGKHGDKVPVIDDAENILKIVKGLAEEK